MTLTLATYGMCAAPGCHNPIGINRRLYCDETTNACKSRAHRRRKRNEVTQLTATLQHLTTSLDTLASKIANLQPAPAPTRQLPLPMPTANDDLDDLIEIKKAVSKERPSFNLMIQMAKMDDNYAAVLKRPDVIAYGIKMGRLPADFVEKHAPKTPRAGIGTGRTIAIQNLPPPEEIDDSALVLQIN